MATYILLMTLTQDGQARALVDPEFLLRAENEIDIDGVTTLGCYAVLGAYDFVTIVEAEDNSSVAMFSIQMGVKAGVHITSLPAVPVARLEERGGDSRPDLETGVQLSPEVPAEGEASPGL